MAFRRRLPPPRRRSGPYPGIDPGNATLRFTPAEGTAIERFAEGNHTVRVTYWPIELGPDHAKDYTWTFHVV